MDTTRDYRHEALLIALGAPLYLEDEHRPHLAAILTEAVQDHLPDSENDRQPDRDRRGKIRKAKRPPQWLGITIVAINCGGVLYIGHLIGWGWMAAILAVIALLAAAVCMGAEG